MDDSQVESEPPAFYKNMGTKAKREKSYHMPDLLQILS